MYDVDDSRDVIVYDVDDELGVRMWYFVVHDGVDFVLYSSCYTIYYGNEFYIA